MNARDNIKPKTIRLAILLALADGAIATIDDLQTRMDEPRARIASNVHPTAAEGLIKRLRDDVTSLPAYQITAKGREHLASFAGGKTEVVAQSSAAEGSDVDDQALRRISRDADQAIVTPGVNVEIPDRHEPTATAIIGAMAFGYQGGNEPPTGHRLDWLAEFHQRGAADAQKDAEIARLTGELATAQATLELSRLAHSSPVPVGYVVKRPGKTLSRFTKAESAQANAMVSARDGKRAQVFALVPAGVAVPGAEWVGA